jgi:hypothetical protein
MAANRKPAARVAPTQVTTIEELLVLAHTEACESHREALLAVKEHYLTPAWLEMHSIRNAQLASDMSDTELGSLFTGNDMGKVEKSAEAHWHDGYRQACEDLLTEVRAYMKGLN